MGWTGLFAVAGLMAGLLLRIRGLSRDKRRLGLHRQALLALLDQLPVGLVVVDPGHQVVLRNARARGTGLQETHRGTLRQGDGRKAGSVVVLEAGEAHPMQSFPNLQLASDVQTRLMALPTSRVVLTPGSVRVDLRAFCHSHQAVGGDFYRVVQRTPDELCLIIGDVIGQGVAAAMVMSMALTLFEQAVMLGYGPDSVLYWVNDRLYDWLSGSPQAFVTALVVFIDASRGVYRMARAGHEPAMLVRDGVCQEVPQAGGIPMALLRAPSGHDHGSADDRWSYRETLVPWERGDRLLLYTDGVSSRLPLARVESVMRGAADADELHRTMVDCLYPGGNASPDDVAFLAAVVS